MTVQGGFIKRLCIFGPKGAIQIRKLSVIIIIIIIINIIIIIRACFITAGSSRNKVYIQQELTLTIISSVQEACSNIYDVINRTYVVFDVLGFNCLIRRVGRIQGGAGHLECLIDN